MRVYIASLLLISTAALTACSGGSDASQGGGGQGGSGGEHDTGGTAGTGGAAGGETGGTGGHGGGVNPLCWGEGSETGSFADNVWTPGFDENGAVNLASWESVPKGSWFQVAGTRLDGLEAEVKAAVPGWKDVGSGGWYAVTGAWTGMAWDERSCFERGWLAVGGGHGDSSNDGIYELDMRRMKWRVERMPNDSSKWPASYIQTGSFTNYNPAVEYYTANPGNPEGVWFDEFFDPAEPANSTRTPTARHTYGSLAFAPELGGDGRILMGVRRYWEYDLASHAWSLPKFPFDSQLDYSGATGYSGENMQGWWNEVEGRYYICATDNYNQSETWSVLGGGTDFRWEGGYPAGGWPSKGTAQEKRGRELHTLIYDQFKPATLRITDLDTREMTDHPVTLGASFSGLTPAETDGLTITWVEPEKKWLVNYVSKEKGMEWGWLDPETWLVERAEIAGGFPTDVNPLVETKLKYFDDMGALVWVNTGNQDIWMIRFK